MQQCIDCTRKTWNVECFSVISGSLSLEAVVWENECIGLAQEYAKAPD